MRHHIAHNVGRDWLGEFAPLFAHVQDDVLSGEIWNSPMIDDKTKSIVTVVSLMATGVTDTSLTVHLQNAKRNGVTREEIAAIITHAAIYTGWTKGWPTLLAAKEIWTEPTPVLGEKDRYQNEIFFPIGESNDAYAQYFSGKNYVSLLSLGLVPTFNVTFEPGCRNNWHIHRASSGGGQMLICVGGRGWYQEEGEDAVPMTPGTIINIPANVRHWHGAAADSWFSHLALEIPGEGAFTEWCEAVPEAQYRALTGK